MYEYSFSYQCLYFSNQLERPRTPNQVIDRMDFDLGSRIGFMKKEDPSTRLKTA